MKRAKKLHREYAQKVVRFIDHVRLNKSVLENIDLEIDARYIAEHVGIDPNMSNAKLANAFASRAEAKAIIL